MMSDWKKKEEKAGKTIRIFLPKVKIKLVATQLSSD